MPDPITRLALAPHVFGTAQAPRSGRLRPLLVGRPHPKRRLKDVGRSDHHQRRIGTLEGRCGARGAGP
jgi:hypothetical protein